MPRKMHPLELDPYQRQLRDEGYRVAREARATRMNALAEARRAAKAERQAKKLAEQQRRDAFDAEDRAFSEKQILAGQDFGYQRALQADRFGQDRLAAEEAARREAEAAQNQFSYERALRADQAGYEESLLGSRFGYESLAAEDQFTRDLMAGEVGFGQERTLQDDRLLAGLAQDQQGFEQQMTLGQQQFAMSQEEAQVKQLHDLVMQKQDYIQQAVLSGDFELSAEGKKQWAEATSALSTIARDQTLSPSQRNQASAMALQELLGVEPVPKRPDQKKIPLEQIIRENTFWDGGEPGKGTPWVVDPETGQPQVARGWTGKTEDTMQEERRQKLYEIDFSNWKEEEAARREHMAIMAKEVDEDGARRYTAGQMLNEAEALFGRRRPMPQPPQFGQSQGGLPPTNAPMGFGAPVPGFGNATIPGFGPPSPSADSPESQMGVPPELFGGGPGPGPSSSGDVSYLDRMAQYRQGQQWPTAPGGDPSYLGRMRAWREKHLETGTKPDVYTRDLPRPTDDQLASPIPRPPKGKEPPHGTVVFMFDRTGQPILAQWNAKKKVYVALGPYTEELAGYGPPEEIPKERLDEPSRMHLFGPGL